MMRFKGRNRMLNQLSLPSPIFAPFFLSLPFFFFYANYKISGPDRGKTFAKHPRTINHVSLSSLTMAPADSALRPRVILRVRVCETTTREMEVPPFSTTNENPLRKKVSMHCLWLF